MDPRAVTANLASTFCIPLTVVLSGLSGLSGSINLKYLEKKFIRTLQQVYVGNLGRESQLIARVRL